VDLPAPLEPSITKHSPSGIWKLTPLSASFVSVYSRLKYGKVLPYYFTTFCVRMALSL